MKINFIIHSEINDNLSLNKTEIFNEDDPISELYNRAKSCLPTFKEEWAFSINGEFYDEITPIQKCIDINYLDKNSLAPVRISIEEKMKITILLDSRENIEIEVYKNISINKSPSFKNFINNKIPKDKIKLYKYYYQEKEIDVSQTPKEIGIKPFEMILASIPADSQNHFIEPLLLNMSFSQSSSQNVENVEKQHQMIQNMQSQCQNFDDEQSRSLNKCEPSLSLPPPSSAIKIENKETQKCLNRLQDFSTPSQSFECCAQQPSQSEQAKDKTFYARIIVNDLSGNELMFIIKIDDTNNKINDLKASDVLNAYCSKCGIESEGFYLFTSKWEMLNSNSPIWPCFIKKEKARKNQNKEQVLNQDDTLKLPKSPQHLRSKVTFFVRQIKEKMHHFDIIVSCIPYDVQEDQLQAYFERFGNVTQVILFKCKNGNSKGIARVTFEKESDANKVLENDRKLNYPDGKNKTLLHIFRPILNYASSKVYPKNVFM